MMSTRGEKTYRPWEPERYRQDAQSPAAKLPAGDWVFFLLDTVPQLERSRFYAPDEHDTRGAPPYDPAMMVCLLLYAYCVGVFSSRKIALACARHLAFLAIVGQDRPDFRTMSDFRTRHLEAFQEVLVQVVRLAAEAGLVKLGNVAIDGTKIQGHASRHKAMSYGYMKQEVERLREDIEALVTQASPQDAADEAALGRRRGAELPAELARREDRLARIEAARRRLETQAQADAEAERQRRADAEAERQRTGKKRRGKAPTPVEGSPDDKAQSNLTDPERHIMRTNNKGWAYCGNAQARVDGACQSIVACEVAEAANDKQQAEPMAQATFASLSQAGLERPQDVSGAVHAIPATFDNGSDSEAAVVALETLGFDPYMATGRQRHQSAQVEAPETPATGQERMAANIRTPVGKAWYARRKVIVEPVFGQIKEARGCRRFLLRGVAMIRGEWRLVCLTHNLLKIWRYGRVLRAISAVMERCRWA
jgi:transposase